MNKKRNFPICIIGTGPCGLGAAWRLQELGYYDYIIFEKNNYPGGLAASFTDASGFTWDIGGHVIHSHYPYFDTMLKRILKASYKTFVRKSSIYHSGNFIPYPFQYNLHHLPRTTRDAYLQELKKIANDKIFKSKNYQEWLIASFGKSMAECFHIPYAQKAWAYPPERMNTIWVDDRVAVINKKRIINNIKQEVNTDDWGPNYIFQYPPSGGNGHLWNTLAQQIKNTPIYNKDVVRIDTKNKIVYFSDGTKQKYSFVLSTIPLDVLLDTLIDVKTAIKNRLHYSSMVILGLGIKGIVPPKIKKNMWIYFPEDDFPFFRATILTNFSQSMAPPNTWSIMCEVLHSSYKPLPKGNIQTKIINVLEQHGIIHRKHIADIWEYRIPRAYPIPTFKRDAILANMLPILESYRIYSRGRFGLWRYEVSNQDHAFMQGVEWVNKILLDDPEITAFNPKKANKIEE